MSENNTEQEDSFFHALVILIEDVMTEAGRTDISETVLHAVAGVLSPVVQASAYALAEYVLVYSLAKNDLAEINAYEDLKANLDKVAKTFKTNLEIQKRYAQQVTEIKFVTK